MSFGLTKYENTVSFDYINQIFIGIYRNIIESSKKNNVESLEKLLDFYQYTLLTKSYGASLDSYSKAASNLIGIYKSISKEYEYIFVERFFESLLTKIGISEDKMADTLKSYIEPSYLPIINILKIMLYENNNVAFNKSINRFKGIFFFDPIKSDNSGYYIKFIVILLSWIYYSKHRSKIEFEKYNINQFEHDLETISYAKELNFINVFFELYEEVESGLWGVDDWYLIEPPVNQVYSPLTPSKWLKYGLIILLLKFENLIPINRLNEIKINKKLNHFSHDFEGYLDEINVNINEYQNFIFPYDSGTFESKKDDIIIDLERRKDKILETFNYIQKTLDIQKYKEIKETPLSQQKINEFRENVGKNWENNTIIANLLKQMGLVNYIPNVESVDGYGFFQTMLKGKFAFIDGEHHQQIFGLTNIGSNLARKSDELFFTTVLKKFKPKKVKEIEHFVDDFLSDLPTRENVILFADWRISDFLKSVEVVSPPKYGNATRVYKGIPVINSYNNNRDNIFIIDFSTITMDIYTKESEIWYKDELIVDITEYSKGVITNEEIQKWNEKEKYEFSMEEVDILESNNINIKVISKFRYNIPDDASILVLDVSAS